MSKPAIEGGSPVRKEFLVFGSPDIQQPEIDEVVDTMRSGWLGTGPKTTKFEDSFADYKKIKHAIGLSSCTAALHLGINSFKLQPGDEVISTDLTFTASISTIIHNQLVPVLCDVEIKSQNIDWTQIEKKITPRTRAILPVHMCGLPCNMDAIMDIASRYNLFVIEDCAHAIETTYNGKHAGTFGDVGAFSFYVTKNIACGEGGMLITGNDNIANTVRTMSLHGLSKNAHTRHGPGGFSHYQVLSAGYKYNMMDLVASIGIHQLNRIEENWKRREEISNKYKKGFASLPIYVPAKTPKNVKNGYHLFTIQLKLNRLRVNRDFVLSALKEEGIGTGVHYQAIHTHPYYSNTFGWNAKEFPNAQWLSDRTLSLPFSSKLADKDVDDVIQAVTKVLTYYRR
jgi:dTDP-4-amino-4,6-dideoxygalactose transaminase